MSVKLPKEALPGERLAVLEEFEGGGGTYPAEGDIRALAVGEALYDLSRRVVTVRPLKQKGGIPMPGDVVLGQVESVQGKAVNVRIYYVNGEESQGSFTGMVAPPQEGPVRGPGARRPRGTITRPGDLIRARVVSKENNNIHLSIEGEDDGVVYALCSVCGGGVVKVEDSIKCVECGNVESRKAASDFGRAHLV